ALARLAFGAGQGVFLARLRMEEDREVAAYRAKAQGLHGLGAGAHHHPVGVGDRAAEQAVAHGAANLVDLHVDSSVAAEDKRKAPYGAPRLQMGGITRSRRGYSLSPSCSLLGGMCCVATNWSPRMLSRWRSEEHT